MNSIEAKTAFTKLRDDKNAILIDVRTDAELAFVGKVDAVDFDNRMVLISWQNFPAMTINPRFDAILEKTLQEKFGDDKKNSQLIFMCRSGARSSQAAIHATQLGYKNCFNLIAGFEGDIDSAGHRSNINGWKFNNLPWRQS